MLTLRWQPIPVRDSWCTVRTAVALADRPVVIHLGLASPRLEGAMERLVQRILELVQHMDAPVDGAPTRECWHSGPADAYRLEAVLGDGHTPIPSEKRLREAAANATDTVWALPLLPADPPDAANTLPKDLSQQHTAFWHGDAIEDLALTVLARAGITSLDRRVFLSYRRAETQPMAEQLLDGLTRLNYSVYLDTVSNDPGLDFQLQLFEHLADKSMVVLLHSATFHQSTWAMQELTYALQNDLSLLALRLPGVPDLPGCRAGDQLPLQEQELVPFCGGSAQALSAAALRRVLRSITEVHDRQLVARRADVRKRLLETLRSRGLHPTPTALDTALHLPAADGSLGTSLLPCSRPPALADLHRASTRQASHYGSQRILVGRTAALPKDRQEQLRWAMEGRNVTFHDVSQLDALCDLLAQEPP